MTSLKDKIKQLIANERKKETEDRIGTPTDALCALRIDERRVIAPVVRLYNERELKEITVYYVLR
jgi:hypothetical protein